MLYAVVEIIALLLLAGLVGVVVGFGIGYLRTATVRRVRSHQMARAELRHRLLEAHQAIVVLERTSATVGEEQEVFTGGIRLSERVARARAEEVEFTEIPSSTQPVA